MIKLLTVNFDEEEVKNCNIDEAFVHEANTYSQKWW